jgi:hypothetical protein
MARFRRLICVCTVAACAAGTCASAATAATFYVEGKGKSTKCSGPSEAAACPTISDAISAALLSPKPNTIEVAPDGPVGGTYEESIELENAHSGELTINGEAAGVVVVVKSALPAVSASAGAGSVALANMKVKTEGADPSAVVKNAGSTLTLDNVQVENESSFGVGGIEAVKGGGQAGLVTMNGGEVIMEHGASGYAILAHEAAIAVNNATITAESQSEAGGIRSQLSSMSVTHSSVHVEATVTAHAALVADLDSSVSLEADSVTQESEEPGVQILRSTASANGLEVAMKRSGSKMAGVEVEGSTASLSHLTVGGTWSGTPLLVEGSDLTLLDSHLTANAAGAPPALQSSDETELVIRRSVLQAAPKATPAVLDAAGGNVTVDSSEIFGGTAGVFFDNAEEGVRTLTLAASTVGPPPGISFEPPGVVGVDAEASGTHASVANASIEGSILLESQLAKAAAGDTSTVACSYSAVPSQLQTANTLSHAGEIGCASGASGNTNSSAEFASLFAEPLHNYTLSPSSSAVDSVPVSAITLPFGLTPSTTDLEGNPRSESVACNVVQDKGALELAGHAAACPAPIVPPTVVTPIVTPTTTKPLQAVLTGLKISPSAFFAALSGGPVSSAAKKPKGKYGAKLTYGDSQAAATTFTVLHESAGRMQGKSCKKPTSKNRHGKRCTLLKKVGSFTHADTAGANSLRFSGRLNGRKLPPGTYELKAVAHDAAGNGKPVEKSFRIEA